MLKPKYFPGSRVGTMTLIEIARKDVHSHNIWRVRCDCGWEGEKPVNNFLSYKTCSFACPLFTRENPGPLKYKDGSPPKKEYLAWMNMKQRCKPEYRQASDYYDRGITVCQEWQEDFSAFLTHIGMAPSPDMMLEREDNDKGYEPGNVKWATRTAQQNNRRKTVLLTVDGITKSMAEWAREKGKTYGVLYQRHKLGWTDAAIVNTP